MKRMTNILLALLLALMLVSCGSTNTQSHYADIPGYLTKTQKEMLKGLKQVDKGGYLYELNYTEDYQLDRVLKYETLDKDNLNSYILETVSPKSRYNAALNTSRKAASCSAFYTKNNNQQGIVGRNYDWNNVESVGLILKCAPANGFKSVGMVDMSFAGVMKANLFTAKSQDMLLTAPYYTVDGINEAGLTVAVLILENSEPGYEDTIRPDLSEAHVVRLLLDKADSVDKAIEILSGYDLYSPTADACFHWIVADKTGKSVVIEPANGKLNVIKPKTDGGNLSVTNYHLTSGIEEKTAFKEGNWRKKSIDMALHLYPNPSSSTAMEILRSVRFTNDIDEAIYSNKEGKMLNSMSDYNWITQWSVVYNIDTLSADIAMRENYADICSFVL